MAEPRRSTSQPLPRADGARFLIVEARYYDAIGDMLLNGAKAALQAAGASWDIIGVPGSLEIPAVAPMPALWHWAASFAARPIISRSWPMKARAG